MVKIHTMSKNIVNIMQALSYNDHLINMLLINENDIAFTNENRPAGFTNNSQIINQNDEFCRISPVPFDPEAQEEDKSFIRVYYSDGEFGSEVVSVSNLVIDIIVAKSLWLIFDRNINQGLIRPYVIMDDIIDTIGRYSGSLVSIDFQGFRHLAVNTKFDAIRLYAQYFKPEV